jgi:LCP family protein required for cell wall assembly
LRTFNDPAKTQVGDCFGKNPRKDVSNKQGKTGMSVTKKIVLSVLGLVVLGLGITGVVIYPKARQEWSAPLGPSLGLPTYTPTLLLPPATSSTSSTTAVAVSTQPVSTSEPALTLPTQSPTPLVAQQTATPASLCGGPPVMLVLALGVDSGIDYNYGLSDAIRIVRVDFTVPKITVLSMPRDLWVKIPDLVNPYGIDHGKLNQAFFYGGPGMGYYKGPGGGPGLLARTLDENFGLRVEHYGAVNMQTFVKIVNAVGGIDVYLPTDVDGRPIDSTTADMGYFYAGHHHFTGDMALRFSRIRKKYNDFTRMDNQNLVLCALKKKITSPDVLPKIPQIIGAFQNSVLTDLSLEQLSQLACLAPKLNRENLIFTSLPQELFTQSRVYSPQQKNETFVLDADYNVIRNYISQFVEGTWPTQPSEPTCP